VKYKCQKKTNDNRQQACGYTKETLRVKTAVKIYISQGSVATQLRCDGIFNSHFIANCQQIAQVKI